VVPRTPSFRLSVCLSHSGLSHKEGGHAKLKFDTGSPCMANVTRMPNFEAGISKVSTLLQVSRPSKCLYPFGQIYLYHQASTTSEIQCAMIWWYLPS